MVRITALLAGWAVCAGLVAAGQSSPQQPTFRGGVEIFHLDVSVLDNDRRPVRGLTAADFTVLEDGKPQRVVALSDVELPAATPLPALWMRVVTPDVISNQFDERRLFVMVLDDASASRDDAALRSVKRIGHALVDRLGPMDLMAVVFTADNRRPQDFTNDRTKLGAAVDRFTRIGGLSVPIGMGMSIETLVRATEFLIDIPERRKALLYIGTGVAVDVALAATPSLISLDASMWNRELHIRAVQRVTAILAAAERANVNIYTFDAMGLRTKLNTAAVEFMQTISSNTGGKAFINTNDLTSGVEQLFRENASYYIVGYESVNDKGPGHWRRLEVRVNRPDVEVRARTRHYTDHPPRTLKTGEALPAVATTQSALAGLLPNRDIPLQVTLAPVAIPGRSDLVAVAAVLAIEGRSSTGAVGGAMRDVELAVSAFDPEGRPRGSQKYNVRAPLGSPAASGALAELVSRMDLKPGAYQLRLALHDPQAKTSGSVYADVEVPDFVKADLSLSGVLLSSSAAPRSAPRDALAPLVPVQPTARRRFTTSEVVTAFVRIYQGGGASRPVAAVTLDLRIIDARDQAVFSSVETFAPDRFGHDRAADMRFELPLAKLRPGEHLLTLDVRSLDGKTARRTVPFAVVATGDR